MQKVMVNSPLKQGPVSQNMQVINQNQQQQQNINIQQNQMMVPQ